MSDYISREAALSLKYQYYSHSTNCYESVIHVNDLRNLPAANVVEVVRCEECTVPHNRWTGCPNLGGLVTPPNFYCAFGKRKEGYDNG